MKVLTWVLILMLGSVNLLATEVIVLRNGKKFLIEGTYEVKGNFVLFKTNSGQLQQLPLKMVDLDKSKEATSARNAAEEKKRKAAEAAAKQVPETKERMSMGEIAAYVEKTRTKENPRPESVALSDDQLEKYSERNPRPERSQAQVGNNGSSASDYSIDNRRAKRDQAGQAYNKLNDELKALDDEINRMERYVVSLENESAFGDDPTSGTFDRFTEAETKLKSLRDKRKSLEKTHKAAQRQARAAGVRVKKDRKKEPKPDPLRQNSGRDQ